MVLRSARFWAGSDSVGWFCSNHGDAENTEASPRDRTAKTQNPPSKRSRRPGDTNKPDCCRTHSECYSLCPLCLGGFRVADALRTSRCAPSNALGRLLVFFALFASWW